MADEGYELIFAFRDQSESFALGFTLGRIRERMNSNKSFSEIIPTELVEDVIALATTFGWQEMITPLKDGWSDCWLEPQPMPRSAKEPTK